MDKRCRVHRERAGECMCSWNQCVCDEGAKFMLHGSFSCVRSGWLHILLAWHWDRNDQGACDLDFCVS